jgi:DEAD/DEAH box helicase domain-containing protein
LSIDHHEAFGGGAGIFMYDGHPGGIGLVAEGARQLSRWLQLAIDVLTVCPCEAGCPSCVQSPKCGNLNEPLSKRGALQVLKLCAAIRSERA